MRAFDWSTTPLGPADSWPRSLRTAVSICLASRFPMLIWWGHDLIMLYNDAYRPILGQRNAVLWHGGTLTARSVLGVGATFTVRLSLAPPTDAADAAKASAPYS